MRRTKCSHGCAPVERFIFALMLFYKVVTLNRSTTPIFCSDLFSYTRTISVHHKYHFILLYLNACFFMMNVFGFFRIESHFDIVYKKERKTERKERN